MNRFGTGGAPQGMELSVGTMNAPGTKQGPEAAAHKVQNSGHQNLADPAETWTSAAAPTRRASVERLLSRYVATRRCANRLPRQS